MKISNLQAPEGLNIACYFIDRNLENGRGQKTAIYEDGRQLNYAQLAEMMNRFGNGLRSLGIQKENRVLMAVPDSAEFVIAFFGSVKIGAVPVPVNTGAKPAEFLYYLNDSGARVFVLQDDLWPQVEPLLSDAPDLDQVVIVPAIPAQRFTVNAEPPKGVSYGFQSFAELLQGSSPRLDAANTLKDDIAFFLYSSGSTGSPKAAVHLQHDMLISAELYGRNILQFSERDIAFSASKLFFAYGLGNGSYFPFSVGAAAVYNPHRPKPEVIISYIKQFRPTLFFSVPTVYTALLEVQEKLDLSSIRYAVSAGEALPPTTYERFKERFSISILDGIGSTEMLHIFISNRPDDIRPGSSGKLVPGYRAKIVDDSGIELPDGEIGNLWIKGDSAAAFYWRKHELSKRAMAGEWLVTGDKYKKDHEGYFSYCGRADDMLKCSGQWVSPVEVENALVTHAAVLECAVVGQKDSDHLVKPKAYIVLKQGSDELREEELRNFLRQRLPSYKVPRWFAFVSELPKTATGKIERFKLRS